MVSLIKDTTFNTSQKESMLSIGVLLDHIPLPSSLQRNKQHDCQ